MAFEKIESSDLIGKLIAELADVPELTADELKQRFDAASKDVIIPKFNKLIEALIAVSAASYIGMEVPEGITAEQNIAAIITALAVSVKSNSDSSHTHSNKVSLDAITADVKEKYDNLVALFSAIKTISDVVKDDSTLLPTGKAIVDYVKELGGGDMLKATYDPDNDGVVDNASKLGGQVPEYYQKSTENTLETDDKTVTGAINEVYGMAQNGGKNLIGEDFSPEKNYTVGKHVINGNNRYRFIVDHPAGPWDASHVEELLVDEEMDELNEKMQDMSFGDDISVPVTSSTFDWSAPSDGFLTLMANTSNVGGIIAVSMYATDNITLGRYIVVCERNALSSAAGTQCIVKKGRKYQILTTLVSTEVRFTPLWKS